MKIAYFHNVPPGGAKRVIYEEVKFLSKKHNLDLYELSSTDKKFLNIHPYFKNIYQYNFEIKNNLPSFLNRIQKDYQNFIKLYFLNKKIAKEIDSRKYDLVILHPDKLTQAPFLLRFLRTKNIYFCEELLRICYEEKLKFKEKVSFVNYIYEILTRQIRKQIDKQNAKKAAKILVASSYIQSKVKKAYSKNAILCKLGVDSEIFKPAKSPKNKNLLFIGGKNEINGYDLAKKLNLKIKIIDFKDNPKLTDKKLSSVYAKSFLTLCLSYEEPFGLVALESMAAGTPVLAINDGGYCETVVNNKTGYLLERNTKEFNKKIEFLINNPKEYKKMSKNCRIYAKNKWSWEEHNKCLEKNFQ